MSATGTHIPSTSPRRNTQSPDTHQSQQTLRNSTSETARTCNSSSDSGDGANTFATVLASNASAVVETAQEGKSDDDGEWPEVNLTPRLSNACNDPNSTCDSGLQELVINTEDPGCANFAMNVGVLGNAGGTPMDGAQNMSFGKSTVDGGNADDGTGGNEGVASSHNFDPSDPVVMAALLTRPPAADPRSPAAMRFDEQVTVTNCLPGHSPNTLQTLGAAASTLTGNLSGASAAGSTQCDPKLSQGDPSQGNPASQSSGNANTNGNPNSNDSNGSGGNQGGSSMNNDPPGPGPVENYLDKLVFAYSAMGGPLENWDIEGTIKVADVVQFTPNPTVQSPHQLEPSGVRLLVRPDVVDRVTDRMHFNNQCNDRTRVRAIINGVDVFVLTAPNARITEDNVTMLEDHERSSAEMCRTLVDHLLCAETLSPDRLDKRYFFTRNSTKQRTKCSEQCLDRETFLL